MSSILYLGCPASERGETEAILGSAGVSVVWVENAAHAQRELAATDRPVLLDLSRGAAALQTARDLHAQHPSALMFAVVDARRPDLTIEAVLAGMADVFARPLGGRRVANAIAREIGYQASPDETSDVTVDDLYSHSPAMRDVLSLVERASAMRAGVLIRGEDGTGRQAIARAIHSSGSFGGAFVTIDCAMFEPDELEVELFGASPRRGSGSEDGVGRGIERLTRNCRLHDAAGGTMYFRNIAEAPTRVQARLARLLRDREAMIVDSGATVPFELRPIASVEPSFDTAVHEGRVRDDLYRRISVIRIDMPPLRARREDIPALANYFVREICGTLRIPPKTLSRPALSLVSALPWRGNAVELRSLLETVVTGLAAGRGIGLDDVLQHVRLDGGPVLFARGGTLRQARARFEREYIASVLEQHHGRISDAAKTLGIQRTNLYRKLRALRVSSTRRR